MSLQTIAVVGGGIGGLASAIFLSKKGFQVTVYDKAKRPQPVGAGFLLQPPGQDILQKLGALQEVSKYSIPIVGLQSKTVCGRPLLDLKYSRLKGKPRNGLGVQRSTIYDALLNKALSQKTIDFQWDSDIEKCLVGDTTVSITTNEDLRHFDLCILASGSNSRLADEHFKNRIKQSYGWGCLWTTFELPKDLSPNIPHQRCQGTHKMMGILPVRKEHGQYEAALYWSMKSRDINAIDVSKFASIKENIMQFWPEAASYIAPLQCNDFLPAHYNDIWTPKPFVNRLIAIGDISHATSPQLGQGCTMALLDAWSLSISITQDEARLTDNLEKWWKSRQYQLAYIRHLSRFLTPLFQSDNKLYGIFRDRVMAPVGRFPPIDTLQLKTLASEVFLNKSNH